MTQSSLPTDVAYCFGQVAGGRGLERREVFRRGLKGVGRRKGWEGKGGWKKGGWKKGYKEKEGSEEGGGEGLEGRRNLVGEERVGRKGKLV